MMHQNASSLRQGGGGQQGSQQSQGQNQNHQQQRRRAEVQPYTEQQRAFIESHIETIKQDADMMAKQTIEPTLQTRKKIMSIIMDYVRTHKRKVYGGVAINALVRAKSPSNAFYDDATDVADIDFYTPYPVQDIKGICDALRDNGIKYVEGKEAQHVETFTIHATYWKCCDISYVQSAIYKKIPVVDELDDGMVYTHPNFMFIDFLRILNDPLTSYFRLDKSFPRFTKLHQLYPLEGPSRYIDVHRAATDVFGSPASERSKKIRIARRVLMDFLPNSNAVVIGMNAYNSIMDLASVKGYVGAALNPTHNAILIEILTTEFASDVAKLFALLTSEVPDVQYTEYHSFYDFLGHRGQFSLPHPRQTGGPGDDPPVVLRVFDNKHKCVPFMEVPIVVPPLVVGPSKSGDPAKPEIVHAKVGTFTVTVMYLMIMRFRVRVENRGKNIDAITVIMYDNMIANLYGARAVYLSSRGKSLLDNTPFKEFVLPCVGDALHALRINHMVQEERFRRYRQRGLKYNPDKNRSIEPYQFSNSSGNIINSPRDRFFNPPGSSSAESPPQESSSAAVQNSSAPPANDSATTNSPE